MSIFPLHSQETAPEGSKELLAKVQKKYGFLPNLFRVMAEAPAAGQTYLTVMGYFNDTSLSEAEQQTVLLTTSFVNQCDYCMAAHSTMSSMKDLFQPGDLEALRSGSALSDAKLNALSGLTRSIVETRGWPTDDARKAFYDAGYGNAQYLEVLVGVSLKTLSNYINHASEIPLDAAFEGGKWTP